MLPLAQLRSRAAALSIAILVLAPFALAQQPAASTPPQQAAAAAKQSSDSAAPCPATVTAPPVPASLAAAQQLYRASKFKEALLAYTLVASAGGADAPAAYAGMARVYMGQNKVSEALDAANQGVALTQRKGPPLVALGEVQFRMGQIALAQEEFLASMKNCEFDPRANLGMAEVALATSNRQYAKHQIDRAHQLDSDDPDIQFLWMLFLPPAEKTKYLRERLEKSGSGQESREGMQSELIILEDEARDPNRARSCRIVQPPSSSTVKLVPVLVSGYYVQGYGVDMKINGARARLQLDTGASGITINHKVAEKAGIQPIIHSEFGGVGDKGPVRAFVGFANSIKIGNLEAQGCYVEVSEKKNISEVDGLIGGDTFSHYLIEVDFPGEKLNLTGLPPIPGASETAPRLAADSLATPDLHDRYIAPSMQSYTMIFNVDDHIFIPTRVNSGSEQKLFMMDTGAFDNMISPSVAKQSTKVAKDYATDLEGVGGAVKHVYRADAVDLAFARFHQKHDDMVSFDMTPVSDSMGIEVSGILGFNMLRMLDIKIDYRDGLVDFQYDPKRVRQSAGSEY
jgi:predicted aspartyl protease